jgi:multisubunit Na+/H+ antiporter MnhG subunit
MGLDIRLPIGLMFTLFGLLLTVYGLVGDKSIYKRSLGLNVNLWWGVVLLIFGVVMLVLGRRGAATAEPAEDSLEGRKMMNETAKRDGESEH